MFTNGSSALTKMVIKDLQIIFADSISKIKVKMDVEFKYHITCTNDYVLGLFSGRVSKSYFVCKYLRNKCIYTKV